MLGLLTGNLADPFFARLARGVEEVSRQQQFRLQVGLDADLTLFTLKRQPTVLVDAENDIRLIL